MAVAKKAVKKPAAKKRAATRKTMTKSEQDKLVTKIVAIYWEQFGRGAKLPVEPGCFDRAVDLGALANVRKNIEELSKFRAMFKQAEGCSFKAGKRAHKIATSRKPKMKTITADVYEEAFLFVASQIDKAARRKGATQTDKKKLGQQGVLC